MATLPFAFGGEMRERKRVRGRFVPESEDGCASTVGASTVDASTGEMKGDLKAPKARHCRMFTRARVAEALPEILKAFVEHAKSGSIAHMKLLTALSGLDKGEVQDRPRRRRKSAVTLLMEEMRREGDDDE
jgi:hypothetical protein